MLEINFGKAFFSQNIIDVINSIEDVFAYAGENYQAFLEKYKYLPEDTLNYELLKKGIACLNEGWVCDFSNTSQEKWYNIFDMRGSGFVFSFSNCSYNGDYAAVGSALRLKNKKLAEHAAKVFLPQYKGYYKPEKITILN